MWSLANELSLSAFEYTIGYEIYDDHVPLWENAKIPTIDIIEYDPKTETNFNKHWHTHGDDMNNINKETLYAVGQTVLHVIHEQ